MKFNTKQVQSGSYTGSFNLPILSGTSSLLGTDTNGNVVFYTGSLTGSIEDANYYRRGLVNTNQQSFSGSKYFDDVKIGFPTQYYEGPFGEFGPAVSLENGKTGHLRIEALENQFATFSIATSNFSNSQYDIINFEITAPGGYDNISSIRTYGGTSLNIGNNTSLSDRIRICLPSYGPSNDSGPWLGNNLSLGLDQYSIAYYRDEGASGANIHGALAVWNNGLDNKIILAHNNAKNRAVLDYYTNNGLDISSYGVNLFSINRTGSRFIFYQSDITDFGSDIRNNIPLTEVYSNTAIGIPAGTSAQRPTSSILTTGPNSSSLSGSNIFLRYNTQSGSLELYNGYIWTEVVGTFNTSSLVTLSSFNSFTSSYNTGSFIGSFTGSLEGTASWATNVVNGGGTFNSSSLTSSFFAQGGNSFGATAMFGTNDDQNLIIETSGISRMIFDTTGSVFIATGSFPTSASLFVSGTAQATRFLARAISNSSTVYPLFIQDSTGVNPLFRVDEAGGLNWGGSSANVLNSSNFRFASTGATIQVTNAGTTQGTFLTLNHNTTSTATANSVNVINIGGTFAPTTGNAQYTSLLISPTINQVLASGSTRGIYIAPTLTSVSGTFIAFENTLGNVVLNSTSGSTLIGNGLPISGSLYKLQVSGSILIADPSAISSINIGGHTNSGGYTNTIFAMKMPNASGLERMINIDSSTNVSTFSVINNGNINLTGLVVNSGGSLRPPSTGWSIQSAKSATFTGNEVSWFTGNAITATISRTVGWSFFQQSNQPSGINQSITLLLTGSISQSVAASGSVVRGLFIDSSIINVAGRYIALENTTGSVVLNSVGNSTFIGYSSSFNTIDKLLVSGSILSNKINIITGSNSSIGMSSLVAGNILVSTTAVGTNSRIFLTRTNPRGTTGDLFSPTSSITNATSFAISSSNTADTSDVNWWIIN